MAKWRLRPPGEFRLLWHKVMDLGPGRHTIWRAQADYAIKGMQEDWRLFQFCLRNHPHHATAQKLDTFDRRMFCKRDFERGGWRLELVVRESTSTLLAEAKIFVKPIDSP